MRRLRDDDEWPDSPPRVEGPFYRGMFWAAVIMIPLWIMAVLWVL